MKKNLVPWETHWFQLSDNTLLELKGDLLRKIIKKATKKSRNLNRLVKKINFTYPSFLYVLRRDSNMVSVKKLRKLADYLNLDYSYFNDKIAETRKGKVTSIEDPKFPFNLKTKEGAYLVGCIVSDGTIYRDKKARNICRTKYSSSDDESLNKFIKNIEKVFGKVHVQKEFKRGNTYLKIGSSIISNALLKVGAPLGNKTKNNNSLPWLIRDNPSLSKSYLNAVFGDEGSSAGSVKYPPYINLNRYNRLNDILTRNEIKKLDKTIVPMMKERKFPTGHITKSIAFTKIKKLIDKKVYNKITQKGISNLLLDESRLLNKLGIETRIWITSLTKTQLGSYTLSVTLFISKKNSVLKFYKEVGFSLTRKQNKLRNSLKEVNWINEPKTI